MRAGASTALVHHYFSTREELLEQALLHSFEQAGDERFAEGDGADALGRPRLAAAIDECLPIPGRPERDWVLWVELWLRAAREPELRPLAGQLYDRYREWMAGVIAAGVESGEFEAPADLDDARRPGDGDARRARPAGAAARSAMDDRPRPARLVADAASPPSWASTPASCLRTAARGGNLNRGSGNDRGEEAGS